MFKVGDKVKIIKPTISDGDVLNKESVITEEYIPIGDSRNWWYLKGFFQAFYEDQLQKIGGSMIDNLNVGDLVINNDCVKKVLAKIDDVVLLSNQVEEDDIGEDDDLNRVDEWYTEYELEEYEWEKYIPGEVKEVTMDEVCKKFGKTVKIIKE